MASEIFNCEVQKINEMFFTGGPDRESFDETSSDHQNSDCKDKSSPGQDQMDHNLMDDEEEEETEKASPKREGEKEDDADEVEGE